MNFREFFVPFYLSDAALHSIREDRKYLLWKNSLQNQKLEIILNSCFNCTFFRRKDDINNL